MVVLSVGRLERSLQVAARRFGVNRAGEKGEEHVRQLAAQDQVVLSAAAVPGARVMPSMPWPVET